MKIHSLILISSRFQDQHVHEPEHEHLRKAHILASSIPLETKMIKGKHFTQQQEEDMNVTKDFTFHLLYNAKYI